MLCKCNTSLVLLGTKILNFTTATFHDISSTCFFCFCHGGLDFRGTSFLYYSLNSGFDWYISLWQSFFNLAIFSWYFAFWEVILDVQFFKYFSLLYCLIDSFLPWYFFLTAGLFWIVMIFFLLANLSSGLLKLLLF